MIKLLLTFNQRAFSENYLADVDEQELSSDEKINFTAFPESEFFKQQKEELWFFARENFYYQGKASVSTLFKRNGLFFHENEASKRQLHAQITALAGSIYHLLGGEHQPLVSYAIDNKGSFYTASKEVRNFTPSSALEELGFSIANNKLVHASSQSKYDLEGLARINLLIAFLDDADNNEGNWGLVFSKGKAEAVKIDTECCFNQDFFKLNPAAVKKILENPLRGAIQKGPQEESLEAESMDLNLGAENSEEESELAEQLRALFKHKTKADISLQSMEQHLMQEAVETLFKITSTPNSFFKNLVESDLSYSLASPLMPQYRDLLFQTLIQNKKIFAEQALAIPCYRTNAQQYALKCTQWINSIQIKKLYNGYSLTVGADSRTGYCPLVLFAQFPLHAKPPVWTNIQLEDKYNEVTIKAHTLQEILQFINQNYEVSLSRIFQGVLNNSAQHKNRIPIYSPAELLLINSNLTIAKTRRAKLNQQTASPLEFEKTWIDFKCENSSDTMEEDNLTSFSSS